MTAKSPRWVTALLALVAALPLALGSGGVSAAQTVVAAPSGGLKPYGAAVNQISDRIYVTNETSNTLSVFDGSTPLPVLVGTAAVGSAPRGVAVNESTDRVYVANYKSNTVSVVAG